MSVTNKQPASQDTFNNAFVSKVVDSTMEGELTLSNDVTGIDVSNTQDVILDTLDTLGFVEGATDQKTYANTNVIADGDNRKVCVEKLDAQMQTNITNIGTNTTDITTIEDSVNSASGICPLDAGTKVPIANLPDAVVGAMQYQGTWNASTNTPTIVNGTGTQGHYYVVSVAGTTNIDGNADWEVGDWIIFNGTAWDKIDNSDKVSSINGQTGVVVLDTEDISEGTGLTSKYTVKHNLVAIADPGVSDDSGSGYSNGSLWVNQNTNVTWSCDDNSSGAASWIEVGGGASGGAGGINYIENYNFEDGTITDWYDNSVNVTLSVESTNPLVGLYSLKAAKGAASANATYIQYPQASNITIDPIFASSMMTVEFYYETTANFVAGDLEVEAYDVENAVGIYIGTLENPKGKFTGDFQTAAFGGGGTEGEYRIRLKYATTNANAYDIFLDEVTFGPQKSKVFGPVITTPQAYTPTFTGFGTATGVSFNWYREASQLVVYGEFTSGTTTATEARVSFPSGIAVSTSQTGLVAGRGVVDIASAEDNDICVLADDGDTYFTFGFVNKSTGGFNPLSPLYGSFFVSSGDKVSFRAEVPVEGWESNVQVSESTSNARASIRLLTGNGMGSTNTTIRRFVTIDEQVGSSIEYADSATLGGSITIVEAGDYSFSLTDQTAASGNQIGFSKNYATNNLGAIPETNRLAMEFTSSVELSQNVSWTGPLEAEDVVRVHTSGSTPTTETRTSLTVTKVINGSQTIAVSERVYVIAGNTSGQSITTGTTTTITGWTESKDSHGSFDASTGIFTAPKDGLLEVKTAFQFSTLFAAAITCTIRNITASLSYNTLNAATTSVAAGSGTETIFVSKGDQIDIRVQQNSGTSRNLFSDCHCSFVMY